MNEVQFEGKFYKDIDTYAQKALDAVNIHTFRYYPQDRVWMASDASMEHFGIRKFYKITSNGNDEIKVVYPDDRPKDLELYRRAIAGEQSVSGTVRSYNGDNYYKITLATIEKDENGAPTIIAGIIEDYDDNMRYSTIAQMLADDFYTIINLNFENEEVVFYRLLGHFDKYGDTFTNRKKYRDIMETYISNEVVEEERAEFRIASSIENFKKVFQKNKTFLHDFRVLRDGKIIHIRLKAVNISEGDRITNAVIGYTNVTKEKQAAFDRLAFFDQITLGPNYNAFSESLKSENTPGYVVSLDIHSFKMVNDICGIDTGDKVLRKVSGIIGFELMGGGYFGHVNADHFIFYVPSENESDVIDIMESIREEFKSIVKMYDIPKITPYFGVAGWNPGERSQVVYSKANTAKHRIKNSNDEFYSFYRAEDNAAAIEEKQIEDAFEQAIAEKRFEVWYQPKYSPVNKLLSGAEALIRWRKADGSLISPGKFIPVFERNGMIRTLDEYVFRAVCADQKRWIEEFGRTVPISINISRASLYYDSTIDTYQKIAKDIGVSTDLLPLEITESAAVMNKDIVSLADRFFKAGFPLCIDDFGTGYSSLSTLNMMKFDTIKLDKSLVDFVGEAKGDSLIKHTIALAKDLGLNVVAEGVESEYQVQFLKTVNCDYIQGFYFDKPMMASLFEEKLKFL